MLIRWQLDHICIWRFFVIKFEIRRSWAITARTITRICRSWGLWLKSRCSWRKQWFFTHLSRLHNQSSKSFASSTPSRVTFYFLHSFFWYYRNFSFKKSNSGEHNLFWHRHREGFQQHRGESRWWFSFQ